MPGRTDDAIRARCVHPSGIFDEFLKEELEQTIPQRFEKIARQLPERAAVESRRLRLTYRELNQLADNTARAVLRICDNSSGSIAVLMEHDALVIAAILGALKAGKCYVPLDPSLPPDRSKFILEDAQSDSIITNSKYLNLAKTLTGSPRRVVNIDEIENLRGSPLNRSVQLDDLCWIIYTSGSTGKPKGVMQTHRNVLHFMRNYTNALRIGVEDRLSLLYSFSVNGGAHDIFAALLNGAAICPYDLKEEGFAGLGQWLNDARVTIYHSVPTVYRQFTRGLTGSENFPNIRIVRLGGEPVYRRDLSLFKKHFADDCILVNRLGSSETGSLRMFYLDKKTEIESNLVPVGYEVEDNEVFLVDESGRPAAGDQGEIAVRTRYVSPGYWRRPDLTAAAFCADPVDTEKKIYRTGDLGRMLPGACLLHLGRKEFFVKIRGYRVELEEIETVLLEFDGIKECVVTALGNNSGEERLVAYVVLQDGKDVTGPALRHFLQGRLPQYMIPARFMFLDALPLTDTLKVNRKALPLPNGTRPEINVPYAPPRDPVEEELARIWSDVLELEEVGIHDHFLDLGGHSISATRIISRVVQAFPGDLPMSILFESATIAKMAEVIVSRGFSRFSL
jgi:amino acid adenylation domain-containing protein